MNAKMILDQLMKQASNIQSQGGGNSHRGRSGGFDVNKIVGGLASQLGGDKSKGKGHSPGGFDIKSLLGGGALGMLLGSKRGRRMGGNVLKYGAIAGAGALAWKAYQNYQATTQGMMVSRKLKRHRQHDPTSVRRRVVAFSGRAFPDPARLIQISAIEGGAEGDPEKQ